MLIHNAPNLLRTNARLHHSQCLRYERPGIIGLARRHWRRLQHRGRGIDARFDDDCGRFRFNLSFRPVVGQRIPRHRSVRFDFRRLSRHRLSFGNLSHQIGERLFNRRLRLFDVLRLRSLWQWPAGNQFLFLVQDTGQPACFGRRQPLNGPPLRDDRGQALAIGLDLVGLGRPVVVERRQGCVAEFGPNVRDDALLIFGIAAELFYEQLKERL